MGSRGPRPAPGRPTLPVELPEMPPDLSPTAQAAWRTVGGYLKEAGIISAPDGLALRLLVESYAAYLDATDVIRAEGIVITQTNTKGASYKAAHPAWGVRRIAWVEVLKACREFGLTPSARCGLPAEPEAEPAENSLEGLRRLREESHFDPAKKKELEREVKRALLGRHTLPGSKIGSRPRTQIRPPAAEPEAEP